MAKIDRFDGNLRAFASDAGVNQRTTFGRITTGDNTIDGNITPEYLTGWEIVGPNEKPTLQDFNAAFFTLGQIMAYVHQVGVPEWNGEQEYHENSMVNRDGILYVCETNNHISETPPESDQTNWFDNNSSGQNIAVFTNNGTTNWAVPYELRTGKRKASVMVVGGGGGGGRSADGVSARGAGGGAGGAVQEIIDLTGVTSVPITVGGGGAGSTANTALLRGDSGASSSFGAYCTALGGTFGQETVGGSGGQGTGGDVNINGGDGSDGTSGGNSGGSGGGGSSLFGGGGRSASGAGRPGAAIGSGGGGVNYTNNAGSGAAGIVIVRW